ncbi:MAG: glutaredoxin family protein [Gallionella sp.]|nr:glutaredoxin family protein [Gallionella sp.]MDP1939763.1 glutaredoxin family protein [Gallionella sp.]
MQAVVILYGTACCHLCAEADAVLHSLGIAALHIDIADDDDLLELYGTRIPVLRHADAELCWPFDAEAVMRLLA